MSAMPEIDDAYVTNALLSRAEYALQHLYLYSMPRQITVVLGNRCNLDCRHCYQSKNDDLLLQNPKIGRALRRELTALYPYLATVRFIGGEVFVLPGFQELIDDVVETVDRPIISINSNGTLIDEEWARRIVNLPFQNVTISVDGGTKETYEKLRRGADFEVVIDNLKRLQTLRLQLGSSYPRLDVFYVIMRSNYREIPKFLELMTDLGIEEVAFQTMLTDNRNLSREPSLIEEVIAATEDVKELYDIVQRSLARDSKNFRRISWCGLQALFDQHGLPPSFLNEEDCSLYPGQDPPCKEATPASEGVAADSEESQGEIKLCPNPWSMLQIADNGDVCICFLSDPVGNIYEMPLVAIWNSPRAIAKRSEIIAGRYLPSGCSKLWCSWREGKSSAFADPASWRQSLAVFKNLVNRIRSCPMASSPNEIPGDLGAVRRLLQARECRIRELEATIVDLWDKNGCLHDAGQAHIDHLESRNQELATLVRRLGTRPNN
jgi:MoaA/NifB/PqqE/SkfB family radical SAM enzyme